MLKTFLVDGDKGGVGKTMVSRIIADAYVRHAATGLPQAKIICLDADKSNPDFAGTGGYAKDEHIFTSGLVALVDPDNWIKMINVMEPYIEMAETEEVRIIISLPAQIHSAFESASEEIGQVMDMLNMVPIWVMNNSKDSIMLLENRIDLMHRRFQRGVVVLNQKFGSSDKFDLWNGSSLKKDIIQSGDWIETTIPVLRAGTENSLGRTPFHVAESTRKGREGQQLGLGDHIIVKAFRTVATVDLACVEKMGG